MTAPIANETETYAGAALGMLAAEPVPILDGRALVFRELSGEPTIVETEQWADRPHRTRRKVTVTDVASLVLYATGQAEARQLELWADEASATVVAVLNAPEGPETPNWTDHRATLALRSSPEWRAWTEVSGKLLGQEELAEFVEDHSADIVRPEPAVMLELAQSFHARSKVAFEATRMLDSGRRALEYRETVEARAGRKGEIAIPATIDLALRPWEGCDAYRVSARLRYRISDGVLRIGVKLIDPDAVLRAAFGDVVDAVEGGTEVRAYRGKP